MLNLSLSVKERRIVLRFPSILPFSFGPFFARAKGSKQMRSGFPRLIYDFHFQFRLLIRSQTFRYKILSSNISVTCGLIIHF